MTGTNRTKNEKKDQDFKKEEKRSFAVKWGFNCSVSWRDWSKKEKEGEVKGRKRSNYSQREREGTEKVEREKVLDARGLMRAWAQCPGSLGTWTTSSRPPLLRSWHSQLKKEERGKNVWTKEATKKKEKRVLTMEPVITGIALDHR